MRYCVFLLGILALLAGCSESDRVEPSGSRDVWFEGGGFGLPEADAEFCKKFFGETGVYLLFNDTLRRELLGTDRYGNEAYFTETVDLSWNLTSTSDTKYLFHYLAAEDRIETGNFLRDRVLSRFDAGIRPFSILLVDTISSWVKASYADNADYKKQDADVPYVTGFRCHAFAVHNWKNLTEEQLTELADLFSLRIVVAALKRYSGKPADTFQAYGKDYYGKYLSALPAGTTYEDAGFLGTVQGSWGLVVLPDRERDMEMFAELCFFSTEEEVAARYSAYPAILKKYRLMKEILADMGYHLNE